MPDIIGFTETWLQESFNSNELSLLGYNIFRCDRSVSTSVRCSGGGVLLAVTSSIQVIECFNQFSTEQIFIRCSVDEEKLIIGCIYIPHSGMHEYYWNHFLDIQALADKFPDHKFIIMGDFNRPNIKWSNDPLSIEHIAYLPPADMDINSNLCSTYSGLNSQQQYPLHPGKGYTLDLMFCPCDSLISAELCDPLVPTDAINHRAATFVFDFTVTAMEDKLSIQFDFIKANYNVINDKLLTLDWNFLHSENDINLITNKFYENVNTVISDHVPLKKFFSSTYPPWYSIELREAVSNKKAAHCRWKESQLLSDYLVFKRLRAECINLSRSCYKLYLEHIQTSLSSNLKYFWSFIKKCKKSYTLPSHVSYNDKLSINDQEASDMFATFFSSVYRIQWTGSVYYSYDIPVLLSMLQIEYDELSIAIKEATDNPNYGPDLVPLYFIKRCDPSIIQKILVLFNKSLASGIFPDIWKVAYIQPIHKKGDKNLVTNYRPISILSALPKLLDKLVCEKLSNVLLDLIVKEQHGFIKGRSTLTNLLVFNDFIKHAFSEGSQVDSIYMDFSKAFDSVQHPLLLAKLSNMGIRGTLLNWLGSYLQERTQIVRLNGSLSKPIQVSSGVPQGSHLGPLLFNLFINDITQVIVFSSCLLFADDLKVYKPIKFSSDLFQLQADITALYYWSIENDLPFNIEKCCFISFSRTDPNYFLNYSVNGEPLRKVISINDLGVLHDQALNFHSHLDMVSAKAHNVLGFITRNTKEFSNINAILYLYKSLVLPLLTYCSQIWTPYTQNRIKILESAQHRFVRYISYKSGHPMSRLDHEFSARLSHLNLSTISSIHTSLDNKFVFKSLNGCIRSEQIINMFRVRDLSYNLRNPNLLEIDTSFNTNYLINSPAIRLARNWNQLPLNIRTLNNLRFFDLENKKQVLKC